MALDLSAPRASRGFLLNHLFSENLSDGAGEGRLNADPVTGHAARDDLRVLLDKAVGAHAAAEPALPPLASPPGIAAPRRPLRFGAAYVRPPAKRLGLVIDLDTCVGCKLSSRACPYGARESDEHTGVTNTCTLCIDRIETLPPTEAEGVPAFFVSTCLAKARHFGDIGDPASAVSCLVAERGGFDLMPELGYRPARSPCCRGHAEPCRLRRRILSAKPGFRDVLGRSTGCCRAEMDEAPSVIVFPVGSGAGYGLVGALGALTALLAAGTAVCTAMIDPSLKLIQAWPNRPTVPGCLIIWAARGVTPAFGLPAAFPAASALALEGPLVERWLFFAEAQRAAMLYDGAASA